MSGSRLTLVYHTVRFYFWIPASRNDKWADAIRPYIWARHVVPLRPRRSAPSITRRRLGTFLYPRLYPISFPAFVILCFVVKIRFHAKSSSNNFQHHHRLGRDRRRKSRIGGLGVVKSAGLTTSGLSKVLCAVIASAVRTWPAMDLALTPCRAAATATALVGLMLQIVTWILPAASLEAETFTAGDLIVLEHILRPLQSASAAASRRDGPHTADTQNRSASGPSSCRRSGPSTGGH